MMNSAPLQEWINIVNKLSAYIIAYNEADKIEAAINSVLWANEVIVIDSHSEDDTAIIAERMGAKVIQVPFNGFGDLRNQAVMACQYDWVFSLDADERCTPAARDEILSTINTAASDVYYIPRRNFFMGRWIRHSGWYPDYRQPQLFRKGTMTYINDRVHERFEIHSNRVDYLQQPIWQVPFKNLAEVMRKANRYSSLGVERLSEKNKKTSMGRSLIKGVWAFLKHYILKLGFLDGWPGFVIALGNFYGTYFRYAKYYEQKMQWQLPDTPPLTRDKSS